MVEPTQGLTVETRWIHGSTGTVISDHGNSVCHHSRMYSMGTPDGGRGNDNAVNTVERGTNNREKGVVRVGR